MPSLARVPHRGCPRPIGSGATPYEPGLPYPLKGDLADHRSVWVNGNWPATFRFALEGAELVDYKDDH